MSTNPAGRTAVRCSSTRSPASWRRRSSSTNWACAACRVGGAFVSDKHANFIQAGDGASAADVRAVIEQVREIVHRESGVLLRSEVRLVGFDDVPADDAAGVAL
ncbi:MAG: hypothetical protein V9E89_11435 [Ilumatobacteraceae bacterium]